MTLGHRIIIVTICILSLHSNVADAVTYVYPAGGGTTAVAPLVLANGDSLDVNSGTFTYGGPGSTVSGTSGATTAITVKNGATLTSTAIFSTVNVTGNMNITIDAGGTVDAAVRAFQDVGSAGNVTIANSGSIPSIEILMNTGFGALSITNSGSGSIQSSMYIGSGGGTTLTQNSTGMFGSYIQLNGAGSILNIQNTGSIGPINVIGGLTLTINVSNATASYVIPNVTGSFILPLNLLSGNLTPTTLSSVSATTIFSGATMTVSNALSGSGTFTNNGTTAVGTGGSLSTTGAFSNTNIFNITNGGSFTTPSTTSNTGTISTSGTGQLNVSNALSGIVTNAGTTNVTAAFTPANGSSNAGTMNINTGGTFTEPGTYTYTGTININTGTNPILGAITGGTGSILTIGKTAAITYTSAGSISVDTFNVGDTGFNGTIFNLSNSLTTVNDINIANGSTLNLQPAGNISGFDNLVINGTFVIESGSSIQGTGIISNSGQITFDGSNINFPGSLSNNASGTMAVSGSPTISLTGPTFTNQGNLIANFSTSNQLPIINIPNVTVPANLDLSLGIIQIGLNNNYIASGNYTLISAGTPPIPGAVILPQNSFYITDWSLQTVGNNLVVQVTRDGFGAHASTPLAVAIGNWLEDIGANNPSSSSLTLLNAFETIQNDAQLNSALLTLLPPQYTMLVTLQNLDNILGALDIRLVSLHRGYTSGDTTGSDKVSAWLRPFSSTGTQQQYGLLNGYSNKNRGYIIGMDRSINQHLTLGAAASYSKTTVTDALQSNTITNINTYQFTFYSTFKSPKEIYVDTLIAGGVSNYHGARTINFPGYLLGAASNYSSQQLTVKTRASKNFALMDLWQFTPSAMAQYSFVRQLAFTENGAGSYNIYSNPDNINLFRLGVGGTLGIPFTTNNMLSIPSVYAMGYVDAAGGGETVNSQFISGGPIITNTVQSGRLMLKYGVSYELKFNDNVEFVANYDYIWRNGSFKGTEGLLNFRYTF